MNGILAWGKRGPLFARCRWFATALLVLIAGYAASALAACSIYQGNTTWGGSPGPSTGNTTGYIATLNEYYFGNAPNFIEVTVTDLNGSGSGPAPISVWQNWGVKVQSKSGQTITTRQAALNQAAVKACYEGQVTYFWLPVGAFTGSGNFPQDSEVLLYDNAGTWTQAIDMLFWKNAAALPALYSDPGCTNLTTVGYNGYLYGRPYQTGQLFGSLGNKDLVRVPNAVGTWVVSGSSNGPAASGTTPVVSGTPVVPGPILACSTSPSNDGISVKKSITTSPTTGLAPGASVGFSVVVKNQTATAQAVTVTDTLPAGMTYVAGSAVSTPAGTLTSFPPTWTTPSLAAGGSATLTFNATVNSNVPDGSSLTNTASAPLPSSTLTATSSAKVTNIVNPLTMTKTVDNAAPAVGQTVTFTVTVTNKQSPAPTSITVTDVLPSSPGTWSWAVTPSAGSTYSAGVWTITNIGNAPLGGQTTATLTATATVPSGTTGNTYTNTAQMTAVSPAEPNLALPLSATASFTVAVPVSTFDACEATTPQCTAGGARLFTKLVGTGFNLDLIALGAGGSIATSFTGPVSSIDLLAYTAANPANMTGAVNNCPVNAASATINLGASVAFTSGRKTVAVPAFTSAYRDVRVRITYSGTNYCSTDKFSVRPTTLGIGVTNSGGGAFPATLAAGANFGLTASGGTGYDGTPALLNSSLVAQTIRTHVGATDYTGQLMQSGTNTITFPAASLGVSNAMVQYHDVGSFEVLAQKVIDSTFTGADVAGTDCVTGSASNTDNDGNPNNGLLYGCNITNTAASGLFGRFYPSYYTLASSNLAGACGSSPNDFTYMGQSGLSVGYTLSAWSQANPTSLKLTKYTAGYPIYVNYATVSVVAADGTNATDLSSNLSPALTGAWAAGDYAVAVAARTYARPTAAASGPYDSLNIAVGITDSDGAVLNALNFKFGDPICTVSCTHKKLGSASTRVRFGRLRLSNAYGSELLNLSVPIQTQYWNGASFVTNTADNNCTTLVPNNIKLTTPPAGVSATVGGAFTSGVGSLTLTKPTTPAKVSVDLCVDLGADPVGGTVCSATSASLPYLQGLWSPGTNYNNDPGARATFGVYKGSNEFIYMREVY